MSDKKVPVYIMACHGFIYTLHTQEEVRALLTEIEKDGTLDGVHVYTRDQDLEDLRCHEAGGV